MKKLVSFMLALLLAAGALSTALGEGALSTDDVFAAVSAAAGADTVQLIPATTAGGTDVVRVERIYPDGRRAYVYFGLSRSQQDTLLCVFYGDPADYTIDEALRSAALEKLNALNATQLYPALFMAESGYIAGHARQALAALDAAGTESYVAQVIANVDEAFTAFNMDDFIPAAPTEAPTDEPLATDAPTDDPLATEAPTRKIIGTDWETVTEKCDICGGTGTCNICNGTGHYPPYGFAEYRVDCDPVCKYCNHGYRSYNVLVYVYDDGTKERVLK